MNQTDRLLIKLETDGAGRVRASLQGVAQDLGQLDRAGAASGSSMLSLTGFVKGLIGAGLAKYLFDTTAQYQKLHAVLETVTGSGARADAVFQRLADFAKRTPFQLTEVVDAFAKLQARGIKPTEQLLVALGNTASGMGKTLDQAVEALADAAVGEFERLKEFGIKASAQGDQVALTFKGVTTTVARNADAITGYLENIGNTDFAGGMERQAATAGGAMSNLKDSAAGLAAEFGGNLTPAFVALSAGIGAWLDTGADALRMAGDLEGAFTRYRKAVENQSGIGLISPLAGLLELGDDTADEATRTIELMRQERLAVAAVDEAFARLEDTAGRTQNTVNDSTQKLVEKLREQAATYGLSKSATLEYEKAQAVAAQTTEAGKQAITEQYDALIKKVKAEEAVTAATQARTTTDKAAAVASRERAKMDREAADVIARMAEDFEAADKAAAEFEATVESLLDPFAELTREYDAQHAALEEELRLQTGNAAAQAKVADALRLLDVRYKSNRAAIEAQHKPVEALIKDMEFELSLMKLTNTEREAAIALRGLEGEATEAQRAAIIALLQDMDIAAAQQAQAQAWGDAMREQIEDVGNAILESFKQGGGSLSDALGDSVKQGLDSAFQDALSNFATEFSNLQTGQGGATTGSVATAAGGTALAAVGAIGASYIGGESSRGESVAGGAVAGAAYGAQMGGWVGAIVGLIIGAIVGWVSYQDPVLEVSSSSRGINHGRVEGRATSALGEIFVGKDDLTLAGNMTSQALAEKLAEFDNVIASFLTAQELELARTAMARFDVDQRGHGLDPTEVLALRFETVVRAVEPAWLEFLDNITTLEDRVNAFQGLRAMRDQVESLDSLIASIGGDPFEQIRFSIANLSQAVEDSQDAFDAAILIQDPVAIAESSAALGQAIMRRYQAEMEMLLKLADAIAQVEQQTRAFNFDIASRIAGVGGPQSGVTAAAASNLAITRANVANAANATAALQHLNEFIATVDQWLQSARAEVQAWHAEQSALLATRLAGLDDEVAGINAAANLRAETEAQYQAQLNNGQQAALQAAQDAERARLQALLNIAQQWVGVLDEAQSLIDELTRGTANPLSGQARLNLYDVELGQLRAQMAGAPASEQAGIAAQITQLLNERLQLAQTLFDRPSGEYLAIYNNTLQELGSIRDMAVDPAAEAARLQAELNALQQGTTDAVTGFATQTATYTVEEAARLEEIEVERAIIADAQRKLDEEQARRLAAIDDEARGYYLWAQTEGQALLAQQHAELTTALNLITGGIPLQEYMAGLQERTANALENIRDTMADFLRMVAQTMGAHGPPRTGPGEPPGDPNFPTRPPGAPGAAGGITVAIGDVHVNVPSGDPQVVRAAVMDALRDPGLLQAMATQLRPELRVA